MPAVPLLKKHYRAKWRTLAWLIIALRLIFPVNIPMIQLDLPVMPEQSAVEQMQPQPEEAPQPQAPAQEPPKAAPRHLEDFNIDDLLHFGEPSDEEVQA